jgi:hypothetical protein
LVILRSRSGRQGARGPGGAAPQGIARIPRQITGFLEGIAEADGASVTEAYEPRIPDLEEAKSLPREQASHAEAPCTGFAMTDRAALTFLSRLRKDVLSGISACDGQSSRCPLSSV